MSTEPTTITATDAAIPEVAAQEAVSAPLAAREALPPIERSGEDAAREPIKHPEGIINPSTVIAPVADLLGKAVTVTINAHQHSNVVSAEAFTKAEENLANYLGQKLDRALTEKDLVLTLSNILSDSDDGRHGGTDLQLCFKGSMIEANFAEMQREVITALQAHPVIGKLLEQNHTLLIDQVSHEEKGQMMHLHLPNMTPEQYAGLIRSLSNVAPAIVNAQVFSITPPTPIAPAVPLKEGAMTLDAASAEVHGDSPTEVTAPVIEKPVIEKPVIEKPTIEKPVLKEEAALGSADALLPTFEVPPVSTPTIELPKPPVAGPTTTTPAPVVPTVPPVLTGEGKSPAPISDGESLMAIPTSVTAAADPLAGLPGENNHKPKPITVAPLNSIATPAEHQHVVQPSLTTAMAV